MGILRSEPEGNSGSLAGAGSSSESVGELTAGTAPASSAPPAVPRKSRRRSEDFQDESGMRFSTEQESLVWARYGRDYTPELMRKGSAKSHAAVIASENSRELSK